MMELHPAIAFAIPFLTGLLTAYLAEKRGRKWSTWFLVGFIFGLIGTAALYLTPTKSKEEILTSPKPKIPAKNQKLWFYLDSKNIQQGPISTDKLHEDLKVGTLTNKTYVWNEDMEDWLHIEKVTDLVQA